MQLTCIVMKNVLPKVFLLFSLVCNLLWIQNLTAQNKLENLDTLFHKFTDTYQENIYIHLNKTKYVKGEDIGFVGYVFHRQSKLLSEVSKNLYCVISDSKDSIIKKKLIAINNGISVNNFRIDETFKSGNYTFKAYTNWMLNFPDQVFSETFEVINGDNTQFIKKVERSKTLDIQFLPESGHLVENIRNTVGIIAKDSLNYGLPEISGEIRNVAGRFISDFQLNSMGIGRYSFVPKIGEQYKAHFKYQDSIYKIDIPTKIHSKGIIIQIGEYGNQCVIRIATNQKTASEIKDKNFLLTFHDGMHLNKIPIRFDNETSVTKKIKLANLNSGVTMFTLFDYEANPIAERLFFNAKKIKIWKSKIKAVKRQDSTVNMTLNYSGFKSSKFNNISISVLPNGTKSYEKNSNIVAQSLLAPFINGTIENAGYYFEKIDKERKYDLDNLLITQGWSSYDWQTILNPNETYNHPFEKGIGVKIQIPKKEKDRKFIIHRTSNQNSQFFNLKKEDNEFALTNYLPFDDEKLSISRINVNGDLRTTTLDLEFSPNAIPEPPKNVKFLAPKADYYALETFSDANRFASQNKSELLDEIFITANLEKRRQERIKRKFFGNLYFVEETERRLTLVDYLNKKPSIRAWDDFQRGKIVVVHTLSEQMGAQDQYPVFFVDDIEVPAYQLFRFWMDDVDYVEVSNFNSGRNMSAKSPLTISIYMKKDRKGKPSISNFKFPLTFSSPKKFYRPKYQDYESSFYRDFGVVDWLPKNKINSNGEASISFTYKQNRPLTLFIEGVTSEGEFIFEKKEISFK